MPKTKKATGGKMKKVKKIFCMECFGTGRQISTNGRRPKKIKCLRCAGTGRVNPPAVKTPEAKKQ